MIRTKLFFLILLFQLGAFAKPLILALNWKPEPQFGGFYAVKVKGFDKESQLELEIKEGGSGTPTLQMVLSGAAEFGIVSGDELILHSLKQKGGQLVALFASYQSNPQCLMIKKGPKSLSLKEVLESPAGTLSWQSGLPYAQFISQKYQIKKDQSPYQGGLQAFMKMDNIVQQCFLTSEPLIAEENKLPVQTFPISDEGFNPYTTVLVVRKDFLEKNKQTVKSVVQVIRKGWEEYLNNPNEINLYMNKLNPSMSLSTFTKSAEAQKLLIKPKNFNQPLGSMTKKRWEELLGQLRSQTKSTQAVKVEELFITEL